MMSSLVLKSKIPIQPYFSLTHMIKEIKSLYGKAEEQKQVTVKTGGRIVGRRKASKDLIFLDIQSNGEQIQIMLDHVKLESKI